MDQDNLHSSLDRLIEGKRMMAVSYREPYIHWHGPEIIECGRPKGWIPRAFDQILRECGGVWIAHGSGNADRLKSGPDGKLGVPPQNPRYTLKRIWLTKPQEKRFYYGFCGNGLWSMCHQVPEGTPLQPDQFEPYEPVFLEDQWRTYVEVNNQFADAVIEEAPCEPAVIWVQDYSMGLLPRLIRSNNPNLVILMNWLIPWPSLAFTGCCPWIGHIVKSMLGSDMLFFDSKNSIANFLQAATVFAGARVDKEGSFVYLEDRQIPTLVFSAVHLPSRKMQVSLT